MNVCDGCRCPVTVPVSHTGGLSLWNAPEGGEEAQSDSCDKQAILLRSITGVWNHDKLVQERLVRPALLMLPTGQWSVVSGQWSVAVQHIVPLMPSYSVLCFMCVYLSTNTELCAQLRNAVWSNERSWTLKLQLCIYLVFILHLNAAGHVYRLSRDRNITGKSSYHWETRVTLAEALCSLLNNRKAVMCIWFGRVAWCVIDI